MKIVQHLTILLIITPLFHATCDSVVLMNLIKDDHLVTLSADVKTLTESQTVDALPKNQIEQKAVEALNIWYSHLPATFGKVTLDAERYKYDHTHPKWQKGLELNYYWGRVMVSFEADPLTYYEIDFLALEDGTILPSTRSYHPEFRNYRVSYTDGRIVSVKEK